MDVLAPVHTVESNEDGLLSGGEGDDDSKAAWRDSDDERIIVSLASNPRLRKLRISETEDLINGKDLTQRLRRQFARLHPAPKWANPAAAQTQGRGKRRKFSKTSNSSEAPELEDDASDNSEELSTPPLAMLLKNAGNLSQSTVGNPGPRKKLQPEVIDIHRIKDVGSDQMVSHLCAPEYMLFNSYALCLVPNNVAGFSSYASAYLNFRSFIHNRTISHLSALTKSSSFTDNPSSTFDLSRYFVLSSPTREHDFFLWPSPLFSHVGFEQWQGRKSIKNHWSRGTSKEHGTLQAKSLWPLDGFSGLWAKRGRYRQHSQHENISMDSGSES